MIDGMPDPQHARPARERDTTIAAAWAILICLGGTQVTFNVASALRHSTLSPVPVLAGLGPVLAAVLLSHLAASRRAQAWFRVAITLVMLCSMAVSIGATVEVTTPVFAAWWRAVLFGIVLDAASLLALWFIMDRHGEKAAAAAAVELARAEGARAVADAREAAGKAAAAEAELAAFRDQSQAELSAVQAELTAATARASALNDALKSRRGSPPKRTRSSPPNRRAGSPVNPRAGSPVNSDASSPLPGDVDTQAAALSILAEKPGISGAELGAHLGVSKSYGCRLKRELAESVVGPDQTADPS